jgi:hypothetical protein
VVFEFIYIQPPDITRDKHVAFVHYFQEIYKMNAQCGDCLSAFNVLHIILTKHSNFETHVRIST